MEARISKTKQFLDLMSDAQYGVKSIWVSYIAFYEHSCWNLYSARAWVMNVPSNHSEYSFETQHIRAGTFELSTTKKSPEEFLFLCERGQFETPIDTIRIFDSAYSPSVQFYPFHPKSGQSRLSVLAIAGKLQRELISDVELKLELNAAETPFVNFDELVNFMSLRRDNEKEVSVEFVCQQSVRINTLESKVNDGVATIYVDLAKGLDISNFSLGVRQSKDGISTLPTEVIRFTVQGDAFDWSEEEVSMRGVTKVQVGKTDLLQCFANYRGINYDNYWLSDPKISRNARRLTLGAFDQNLELTGKILLEYEDKQKNSNAFDVGVSWLFWMLGFSTTQLDVQNITRPQEAPDLLFCDDRSNFLVVEATVGAIQNKQKLDKLWERTQLVRETLEKASLGHLEVLPVMVTRQPAKMVEQHLELARKLGISVVTNEMLSKLLQRTSFPPEPHVVMQDLRSLSVPFGSETPTDQ